MLAYRRLSVLVLVSTIATSVIAFGSQKQRHWQDGKVLDPERSGYFAGTGGSTSNGSVNGESGTDQGTGAVYHVSETFLIEGDKYVYMVREHLKWRWSKAASLTVNGPVKYAVERRKLFLMDEDGKEHEMEIVKLTTLRLPDQSVK